MNTIPIRNATAVVISVNPALNVSVLDA